MRYRMRHDVFQKIFYLRSYLESSIWQFFTSKQFIRTDPNILTCSDCEGAGELFMIHPSTQKVGDAPFFGKDASGEPKKPALTVSSQLPLEFLCAEVPGVWTLNPSFRAEKSSTQRHLSEFRHLEWESHQLGSLTELLDFNEEIVRFFIVSLLKQDETLKSLSASYKAVGVSCDVVEHLKVLVSQEKWTRISYTDALDICLQPQHLAAIKKIWGDDFQPPQWGDDLGTACERYLTDYIYKAPILVHSYPRSLKSFYMKLSKGCESGRETVESCDLLMPGMGELIGSSVREEDYETLMGEMKKRGMTDIPWYTDLRKNASFPHGGAGLGFDRLVQALLFKEGSIRDVVPIPVAWESLYY